MLRAHCGKETAVGEGGGGFYPTYTVARGESINNTLAFY